MRVLFWSSTFLPAIGGVEVLAARLLPALKDRGFECMVVTPMNRLNQPQITEYSGIPVYRFLFRSDATVDRVMAIRKQVASLKRAFAPDLIHINAVDVSAFFHLTTVNAHPAPLLVTLHNERVQDKKLGDAVGGDKLLGVTLRSADWVTCVSAWVLARVRQRVPEIIPNSSLIYNGLEMPPISPEPLPMDVPRLLCLGRLIARKGFDVALKAFATIVHRYPHVRLTIGGDGPARTALEQQAAELGVRGAVNFVGWVAPENVPALIKSATLVVMPSRHEPFGLVALDAALMARPIVASRVGGLSEVVIHQQTGLLVEPDDSAELVDAIIFLLDHPERATLMGQAARRRALGAFSWESCVSGYAKLYRSLLVSAQAKTDWRASKSANGSSGKAT